MDMISNNQMNTVSLDIVKSNNCSMYAVIVYACPYKDVTCRSPIYNVNTLRDTMFVRLPDVCSRCSLLCVSRIHPSGSDSLDISSVNLENVWLKIPTDILDLSTGSKVYKIDLETQCSKDPITLYFGYVIQDDNPDKSYVYMNQEGKTN